MSVKKKQQHGTSSSSNTAKDSTVGEQHEQQHAFLLEDDDEEYVVPLQSASGHSTSMMTSMSAESTTARSVKSRSTTTSSLDATTTNCYYDDDEDGEQEVLYDDDVTIGSMPSLTTIGSMPSLATINTATSVASATSVLLTEVNEEDDETENDASNREILHPIKEGIGSASGHGGRNKDVGAVVGGTVKEEIISSTISPKASSTSKGKMRWIAREGSNDGLPLMKASASKHAGRCRGIVGDDDDNGSGSGSGSKDLPPRRPVHRTSSNMMGDEMVVGSNSNSRDSTAVFKPPSIVDISPSTMLQRTLSSTRERARRQHKQHQKHIQRRHSNDSTPKMPKSSSNSSLSSSNHNNKSSNSNSSNSNNSNKSKKDLPPKTVTRSRQYTPQLDTFRQDVCNMYF